MFSDTRRISTFSPITPNKPQKSTEAIFVVEVQDNPKSRSFSSFKPSIKISIDLSGIYGNEGYPTPGEGSFVDLLREGVYSRQLKVDSGSKRQERQKVGNLFMFCTCVNLPELIKAPDNWGADLPLLVNDFNDIFKDATMPVIKKHSRLFKLIKKLLITNCYGDLKSITFLGYY